MAKRATSAKGSDTRKAQPNILIIWGDDIGWFNVSAYNHGIMGGTRLELVTSTMSTWRSNQLS